MAHTRNPFINSRRVSSRFLQKYIMSASRQSYYMPSEQSPHLRTLTAWPDESSVDNHEDLLQARREVASIANTIAKYEPVWLYTKPSNVRSASKSVSNGVEIKPLKSTELWIRDTGPIIVSSEDPKVQVGIDFNFNYWGDKLPAPRNADQHVARRILSSQHVKRVGSSITLEGGALETDGQGTLLATSSSILNSNRNPSKCQADIEAELRQLLGVDKIIWIPGAKGQDITDCHIDALARFGADSRTILLSRPNDAVPKNDPAWEVYQSAHEVLTTATNAAGATFAIYQLEEALTVPRAQSPSVYQHSQPDSHTRVPVAREDDWAPSTSYLNFYLANGVVVVPQFGDAKTDEKAKEVLGRLWPERVVEGVRLDWMAWAGGGVHCATREWAACT